MKKRTVFGIIAVLAVLFVTAGVLFKLRYDRMVGTIARQPVGHVNMEEVDDGVYSGSFGDFLLHVSLEVTVADGRMTGIEIVDQRSGPGYGALETLDLILDAQSPLVDAVSGATGSSRCIMISVYRALAGDR